MKGADAEERAARFLAAQGREILSRNYRIPGGEIDLVTREGGTLVFTEVGTAAQVATAALPRA